MAYSPLDGKSANSIQTTNTLRELVPLFGDRLTIIVPRFGNETVPFSTTQLQRIPINKLSRLYRTRGWSYLERIVYAERVKRVMAQTRPDLIYTRDIVCADRFVQAGLPTLYEVHDLESQHPGQATGARLQKWLAQVDERTLRGARGVASLTEAFRQELIVRGWRTPESVFVIPDAFDERAYYPRDKTEARRALNLPANARLITYAGLTFKYRGLDVLLDAFAKLNDSQAQLILVGGRDFEIEELRMQANQLGVQARVTFAGRHPASETVYYLAAADVLVIPDTVTDATASPLKMFEYMAMARPIVTVDRAALREILGEAALYFPRGDAAALSAQIRCALEPAANVLGEKARARSADYTYAQRAAKIVRAAEAVLQA